MIFSPNYKKPLLFFRHYTTQSQHIVSAYMQELLSLKFNCMQPHGTGKDMTPKI